MLQNRYTNAKDYSLRAFLSLLRQRKKLTLHKNKD